MKSTNTNTKQKALIPPYIKLLFKICITTLCLWYVSSKIDWSTTVITFKRTNLAWLALAVILFIASKIVAAIRLTHYFRNIDISVSRYANLKLYWLGMFYNLFLPGGIGGDAYKVIILLKTFGKSRKLLAASVLLDRVSGVVGLLILGAFYYYYLFPEEQFSILLLILILPGLAAYYFLVKQFFPSFRKSFLVTFWLGLLVQGFQVICAYTIMYALHIFDGYSAYVLIFLISSVVAILPFTLGGLGAREVVFLWGSQQFLLSQQESICISLLFYLITAIVSLSGVVWVYKDPLKIPANNNTFIRLP